MDPKNPDNDTDINNDKSMVVKKRQVDSESIIPVTVTVNVLNSVPRDDPDPLLGSGSGSALSLGSPTEQSSTPAASDTASFDVRFIFNLFLVM